MLNRRKTTPKFKQMAFETAVRNPERYKGILLSIYDFENQILNDETLLKIVCNLYLNSVVTSSEIILNENDTLDTISSKVIEVNSTRKADGGFPAGYQSRFWTYMRTLCEMGFVYARYNENLLFSKISVKLIHDEIDEQEAFSIQAIKYNRKSPYRNISNDFNFFRFIINILKSRERISLEQFIVATFSQNGNVEEFSNLINDYTFNDLTEVEIFLRNEYGANNKAQTILRDYPDVVLRLLIISGFVSIQYQGKVLIYLNKDKINYINSLLNVDINLTDLEKEIPIEHFKKLETYNSLLLKIIIEFKENEIELDGFEYAKKVEVIIKQYDLNEELIIKSINQIGSSTNIIPAFRYIAEPLKLEFYISLLLTLKYGHEYGIRPNYKADYIGVPISHAPGNAGDIEVYSKKIYWLIEVTLIRNKAQQLNNETSTVIRHFLADDKINKYSTKYLSFVAPYIHQDTKDYFDYSIVRYKINEQNLFLKPYSIIEFIESTKDKINFNDMEIYTKTAVENFKNNLN